MNYMKKKREDSIKIMVRDTALAAAVMAVMTSMSAISTHAETVGTPAETSDTLAETTGAFEFADVFTERDLAQTADLTDAASLIIKDGEDTTVSEAGVYVITGDAQNAAVIVDAPDDAKVQLVLDGLSLSNEDRPCIYVKNADKVFVTMADSANTLTVSGAFSADGETNTDAVIFSRDDLILNGTGNLTVSSTENGISSKDDLKITGGAITISCAKDGLEANESIAVADGTVTITAGDDGLQAGDEDSSNSGNIYIADGALTVTAADDAVRGNAVIQIDNGSLQLAGRECIEATWIRINGGTIGISASDDGINATAKSDICTPRLDISDGDITIVMEAGDTDAVDVNGDLSISGGTLNITAQSPFDCDGQIAHTGGTLIINGEETTEIANQMMGGRGGMGGFGGMGGQGKMGGQPGIQNGMRPGGEFGAQAGHPGRGVTETN